MKTKKKTNARHVPGKYLIGIISLVMLVLTMLYIQTRQTPCANSKSCKDDITEKIENGSLAMFQGKILPAPLIHLTDMKDTRTVLGASVSAEQKHIYVDLSVQKLYAYEGENRIFETFVSTGRWGRTPTGNFNIWIKLRSTRMAGGSGDDAYNLPNVPYTMYFYHDFGLHGAYWHNNFGHTMSHGCVNLRQIDAEFLFNWADGPANGIPGTAVSVCDTFAHPNLCNQTNPVR